MMSDAEWKAVKEMSPNATSQEALDTIGVERHLELLGTAQRINGSYHPYAKRGINNTVFGSALMQMKNWMPEAILNQVVPEHRDMFGNVQKGIMRSLFDAIKNTADVKGLIKNVFTGNVREIRRKLNNLSAIDKANLHKAFRQAYMIAAMMLMRATAADDQEDKMFYSRIIQELTMLYNLDSWRFTLTSPVPAIETFLKVWDGIEAAGSIISMTGETYKRDTDYGREGWMKAPIYIMNTLPASKLTKTIWKNVVVPE